MNNNTLLNKNCHSKVKITNKKILVKLERKIEEVNENQLIDLGVEMEQNINK